MIHQIQLTSMQSCFLLYYYQLYLTLDIVIYYLKLSVIVFMKNILLLSIHSYYYNRTKNFVVIVNMNKYTESFIRNSINVGQRIGNGGRPEGRKKRIRRYSMTLGS